MQGWSQEYKFVWGSVALHSEHVYSWKSGGEVKVLQAEGDMHNLF